MEPITAATIKNVVGSIALNEPGEIARPMRELSADHVLIAEVLPGKAGVSMRLIHTETTTVVGQATAAIPGSDKTILRSVRSGVGRMLDEVVIAIAQNPGELRLTRVAVAPFEALDDGAGAARIERLIRAELEQGLIGRGFLVVERTRLADVGEQLALGQNLSEASAPKLGKALGAQTVVLGSVADAGDAFVVAVRVVDVESGKTVGAASTKLRRKGAVTLASRSIETRTPGEALFRSAIAPGWGQAYNQEPVKSVVFGALTYGALLTTIGLGAVGAILAVSYDGYTPAASATPEDYVPLLKGLRDAANGFYIASAIGVGVTAVAWGAGVTDAFFSAQE